MIENPDIKDWKQLQEAVCRLFNEVGLTASDNSMDVLEDFAKHVASRLESLADPDSLTNRFQQALHEYEQKP